MAIGYIIVLLSIVKSSSSISDPSLGCFESIISFGDSHADTGNWIEICRIEKRPSDNRPPYGETFFHHPAGRASDGRIVLDFIAESLGLPLVQPYLAAENADVDLRSFSNFAVCGATALDVGFFEKRGIHTETNVSLGTQLDWFKQFLANLPDGREFLKSSLVVMGEIGGNDYILPLVEKINKEVIRSFAPTVVNYIGSTIEELIKLGVKTLLVPDVPPIGCLPIFLTQYQTSNKKEYDPMTGCLNWLNKVPKYHNKLLQKELNRIQMLHPEVAIIYADYYNAILNFYLSPNKFGFAKEGKLRACCGAGGPYNFNLSTLCGVLPATSCNDPSSFISWDGLHFTETANRVITQSLLDGPYTTPQIKTVCLSIFKHPRVYNY